MPDVRARAEGVLDLGEVSPAGDEERFAVGGEDVAGEREVARVEGGHAEVEAERGVPDAEHDHGRRRGRADCARGIALAVERSDHGPELVDDERIERERDGTGRERHGAEPAAYE